MKITAFLIAALLIVGLLVANAVSGSDSPMLEVASSEIKTVKSVTASDKVSFEASDFDDTAGIRLKSITVLSLPEKGRLMLGNSEVMRGQIIARSSLEYLSYVFEGESCEADFEYGYMSSGKGYTALCKMYRLDEFNLPPVFDTESFSEYGIAVSGKDYYLRTDVCDPESDPVSLSVVSYPENGVLALVSESGDIRYRAGDGYEGSDSFTLVARDLYGNESGEFTVYLSVVRCTSQPYCDLEGSRAESAAELLREREVLSGYSVGSSAYFEPSSLITKEEFVAAALSAAGITDLDSKKATAFADENKIDENLLSAVSYAFDKGWLDSEVTGAVNYFEPKKGISYESALAFVFEMIGVRPCIPLDLDGEDLLTGEAAAMLLERVIAFTAFGTR